MSKCYNESSCRPGYSFPEFGCANATLVEDLVDSPGNHIYFNIYCSQKNGFEQDISTYLVAPSIMATTNSWTGI